MKKSIFSILAILAVFAMVTAGCKNDPDDPPPAGTGTVTLTGVTANGSASSTTTSLNLVFSAAITGLSAGDITVTGVSGFTGFTKGTTLTAGAAAGTYTLPITVTAAGSVSVSAAKSGYAISGSPKTAALNFFAGNPGDTQVTLNSVTANGAANTTTSTQLTLAFSAAIDGLSAGDITVTGAGVTVAQGAALTAGTPAGTYTLPITVTAAGSVSVAAAKSGYNISGSPATGVAVHFASNSPPPPPPPTGDFFVDSVGLETGIGTYGSGSHSFEGGILTITGNGGFSVALPEGFTVADTVKIELAAKLVEGDKAKFIAKQAGGWTNVNPEAYPEFEDTVDEAFILSSKGFSAAGVTDGKAYFQTNNNPSVFKVQIKIISVTREEGVAVKITAGVPGLKPASGEAPKTTVETDQYTGTVAWNPAVSGNFAEGTAYTATIVLTKKPGYTFEGVDADAIAVVGATTANHVAGGTGTLTITAVFAAAAALAPVVNITFADDTEINGFNIKDNALTSDSKGFTFETTQGYGWAYGYIKVDFGTFTLGDYSKLDFTFTGVSGDINAKNARVWIVDAAPTGEKQETDAVKTAEGNGSDGTQPKSVSISLDTFTVQAKSIVYVAFNLWSNSGAKYTISNIKFHHGDE